MKVSIPPRVELAKLHMHANNGIIEKQISFQVAEVDNEANLSYKNNSLLVI